MFFIRNSKPENKNIRFFGFLNSTLPFSKQLPQTFHLVT